MLCRLKIASQYSLAILFWLFLLTFSNLSQAKACDPQTVNYTKIDDTQLLIINLRINNHSVIADLEVYQVGDRLLLSVSALQNQLKLAIQQQQNKLSGTLPLAQPKNQKQLKCKFSWTLTKQQNATPTSTTWLWSNDGIDDYIDARALNALLGGDYKFDYSMQQINIYTKLKLAIFKTPDLVIKHTKQEIILPDLIVNDQYHWLNYPVTAYQIKTQYQHINQQLTHNAQLNSFFDFLGQSAELRVNQNNGTTHQYLKLSRDVNADNSDFASYLSHYDAGDIQVQSDELIHNSAQGAGFYLSNKNPTFNSSFNSITIEQPALPGWRAELYRNGQFLAETTATNDNRVVFNHVDTFYGTNVFDIKLYGPEGQQVTRTQKISVGTDFLSQHDWNYQIEYIDTRKRVIDNTVDVTNGFTQSAKATISYGLTNNLTLDVATDFIQQFTEPDANTSDNQLELSNHYYVSSGIHGTSFNGGYQIQLAKDNQGGNALYAGFSGNLPAGTNINLAYRHFNHFISAQHAFGNQLAEQFNAKFNGNLDVFNGINWYANFGKQYWTTGEQQFSTNVAFSKNIPQGSLSSSFSYDNNNGAKNLLNRLYWSINLNSWHWSNSVDWYPLDHANISQIRTDLRWPQQQQFFQQTQIIYQPQQSSQYQLIHQFTYRQRHINLQLSGQIDEHGNWLVSAGISGTFGYEQVNNKLLWLQPQALNAGLIEASVFLDKNRNDRQDPNEQGLADVQFKGRYNWTSYKSNAQGKVLLPSTLGGQNLSVKETSLADPYMKSKLNKILVHTHKGGVTKIQIPILTVNDIEGTIYQIVNKKTKAAAAQTVVLLNMAEQVVAQTHTEYDGYFMFNLVPPGTYSIAVRSKLINEHNLTPLNLPQKIVATPQGDSIVLNDILLVDDAYLLAQQQQTAPQQLALEQENDEFFIQLGVYNQYISIYTAAKSLPASMLDIQIFLNLHNHRYYLVAGPFKHAQDAAPMLAKLKPIKQFNASFLVRTARYHDRKWQLNYSLHDLPLKLNQGYEIIKNAPKHSYFCQLASYQALNSIEAKKFTLTDGLFIVKRQIHNKRYYNLMIGPFTNRYGKDCQLAKYQHITDDQPTDRTSFMLKQEVSR